MHGLKARKFKAADQMIGSISCRLEMEDMLEHPAGLSSGQKQRVALERAVVRNPPVPLFDEPSQPPLCVGAAAGVPRTQGPATRIRLHHHRRHTRPGRGLSLATPLAVMDAGVVQQFGTPDEVFDDPANLFVAQFVGEAKINALRGTARVADGRVRVEIGSISAGCTPCHQRGRRHPGHRGHPAAGAGSRPIRRRASPLRGLFRALLEFGLATSTVAKHGGRHRGADCRRRKLRARAAGGRDGAAGARLPLRHRFGGTLR